MKKKYMFAVMASVALVATASVVGSSFVEPSKLLAEGETASSSAEAVYPEVEKWYTTAVNKIEQTAIAFLGGTTAASLLGIIVTVSFSFVKANGDKKTRSKLEELENKVKKAEEVVEHYKVEFSNLLTDYNRTLAENRKYFDEGIKRMSDVENLLKSQNIELGKILVMKDAIVTFGEIAVKAISLYDVAVKNGVAQEAAHAIESLKEIGG